MRRRRTASLVRAALLTGIALAASVATPAASESPPTGWSYGLTSELMSPYCPGRTLADCPSGQAEELRMWIRVQEAAGRTRADVRDEVIERFGDVVLAAPRAEGFGIAAYAIPIAVFLAGGILVGVFLRRQTRATASGSPAAEAPLDPELERLVDEELAR